MGTTQLQYERLRPRWYFWGERFRLTADFKYIIPDSLTHYIDGPYIGKKFALLLDDDGRWCIWIRRGYVWDGATLVLTTDCVVLASLLHDVLYDYIRELAVAWGVPRARVRAFANALFTYVLRAQRSWARRIYPWGVERVGGLWSEVSVWLRERRGS